MKKDAADLVAEKWRLRPSQRLGLAKLKIVTVRDLLYHFPSRYETPPAERRINELRPGQAATVYGQVGQIKVSRAFRKKIPLAEAVIEDGSGRIKAVWFHQVYLAKKIRPGEWYKISGRVSVRKDQLYFANPVLAPASQAAPAGLYSPVGPAEPDEPTALKPIYPETCGLSGLWLEQTVKSLLADGSSATLIDPLPETIRKRYRLPALGPALALIHQPRTEKDFQTARKRFAFEEVWFIQLARQRGKIAYRQNRARPIAPVPAALADFLERLPFLPTSAQKRTIAEISADLGRDQPMLRLLEGDVGSGKTVVAAAAAFLVARAGQASALMAPTEILARQHFESLIKNFYRDGINIGLITSSECRKFPSKVDPRQHTHISRGQLLKWVANGEIPIVVGTQSLIQKTVSFKNLALAIIDEQHRFGVRQRAALVKKAGAGLAPHLLSLSATPIPRTLALTIYGDLDLTLLDELPPGRRPIKTAIVTEDRRGKAYKKIKQELARGRQAYVICPRIDRPDPTKILALYAKSAKQEAERLQREVFPAYRVGLLHSKLKPKDKEKVMADFARGAVKILVATSVVEVGVNVPNATMIVIEGAERFGLAQLYQLRGRIWRSDHQAHCFLFTEATGGKALKRLRALETAPNGFALAELDLQLRGAGSLTGDEQWGLSDLGMEALQNLKMVQAARAEAENLLTTDPELANYPLVKERLDAAASRAVHFE